MQNLRRVWIVCIGVLGSVLATVLIDALDKSDEAWAVPAVWAAGLVCPAPFVFAGRSDRTARIAYFTDKSLEWTLIVAALWSVELFSKDAPVVGAMVAVIAAACAVAVVLRRRLYEHVNAAALPGAAIVAFAVLSAMLVARGIAQVLALCLIAAGVIAGIVLVIRKLLDNKRRFGSILIFPLDSAPLPPPPPSPERPRRDVSGFPAATGRSLPGSTLTIALWGRGCWRSLQGWIG